MAWYCIVINVYILYCNVMQCNTGQRGAMDCNAMQCIAMQCNECMDGWMYVYIKFNIHVFLSINLLYRIHTDGQHLGPTSRP